MKYSWKQVQGAGTPQERSSHAVSMVGTKLYVLGGENVARTPIDNTVHTLEMTSTPLEWTTLSQEGAANAPCARIAHTQVELDGKIWTFGGRYGIVMDEGALGDLHCFDPATNTWREVKADNAPGPRSFHAMASAPGKLYVFGGCLP